MWWPASSASNAARIASVLRLAEDAAAGRPEGQFISYWKPKLHAQLLIDTEPYELGQMPPLLQHYLHNYRLMSGHRFRPLVYVRPAASH